MSSKPPATLAAPLTRLALDEALAALSDELNDAGQELRDAPEFRVDNRGQGLWVARVAAAGEQVVESEVQLSGRRIRDYACECGAFAKTSPCAHVAALLAAVHLRRQVRTARRSAPPKPPKTVSTRRLLQSVDEADLRSFVADYARRHPDFALDLRVRFAEGLSVPNRFESVVRRLLKRTGKSYGPSQARRISEALEQFAEQRARFVAERAFLDLFELNSVLAPRLIVVAAKADRLRVEIPEYVAACLGELAQLALASPPPVLLERLETWLAEQLTRGAYFRQGVGGTLIGLADALAPAGDRGERALGLLAAAERDHGALPDLIEARTRLLYAHDRAEEAEAILLAHLHVAPLVNAALQAEVAAGRTARAVRLAEAAHERQTDPAERLLLARFIAAAAAQVGRPELLPRYVPPVVVADADLDSLGGAFATAGEAPIRQRVEVHQQWLTATREACLAAVEVAASLRAERRDALRAELLTDLGRYAEVESLLYRTHFATVVAAHLPPLVGRLPDPDLDLLLDSKLREHLADRFGRGPAEWAAALLDAVARRSRGDLAAGVAGRLRRDYAQRPALIDALDAALL